MPISVGAQSDSVKTMASNWPVVKALMGGTSAMRAAGKTFMPKQPREDDEDYEYRLQTATLFPAFARTVSVMAGKPFSKEIAIGDDVPSSVLELLPNIDGQGRSMHAMLSDVMAEVMAYGFGGILIDYTRTAGRVRTQADELAIGARPFWIHIRHDQILGWKTESVNGVMELTQLRISETEEVDSSEFGTEVVKRTRVLTPGSWRLFDEKGDQIDSGDMVIDGIPFVPFYGKRESFMVGTPPLLDLAWQNVKHWQQQSDQDDSARFARKRLLAFVGLDETTDLTTSSSHAIKLPVGGDAKVIQGSAESVTVGRSELDALEDQMIQTGAELLTATPGTRTATEAANDAEANKSDLQRIVENFEDSIDQCLQFTAQWLGESDGGHATVFKDFAAGGLSEASAQLLLSLQQGGAISKETLIREQQRRGVLSPDLDPAKELQAVSDEGPPLGLMSNGNGQ